MANQNNLIRPPILGGTPPPQAPNQFIMTPESEASIANIVRRVILEERTLRETEPRVGDQGIDRNNEADLSQLDKIPDVVRSLREFNGNRTEFGSWKKSAERILKIYEPLKGTAKYFGILNVVRNKIIGDADIAIESYNTPLNWECIIKCLTTHYADQRDLGTLEYQLTSMVQGTSSVQEFYQRIYSHLSLILNKVACLEESQDAIHLLTKNYRNKALDTFVRGLKGDLPRLLGIKEPNDLHEALHLCLKLDNQQFRTQYANNTTKNQPNIPHQKFNNTNHNQTFYPQLTHIPQTNMTFPRIAYGNQPRPQYYNPNKGNYNTYPQQQNLQLPPPRPNQPKPPVPMEVDPSMHSRKVNYMNRPAQDNRFSGVRPLPQSAQFNQPRKLQRINHIEQDQNNPAPDTDIGTELIDPQQENEEIQYLTEYLNEYFDMGDTPIENENDEFSDINFLRLTDSTLPYFQCKTNDGHILKFLIDTGSNKNYIQPSLIRNPIPNEINFQARSAGGNITITHHTFINLFGLRSENLKFFLLPSLKSFSGILGHDSLTKLNAVIFTSKDFMLINNSIKVKIKQQISQSVNAINLRTNHLTKNQKDKLNSICNKYKKLFTEPNERLTFTTKVKADIRTTTDDPIYSKSYPYPITMKDEVEKQITELLDHGIIRPSRSPYNSPVIIVPKKLDASGDRKYRMVIDYRKLNQVTIPDRYPIPEINDVLSNLGRNKWFSVLDLKSGFHQIPLRDRDIEKTAFSINNGKYEFTRLPFGLKNAPAIFQRALDDILREHIGKICYVYIDDIIVFGPDEISHLKNIETIFNTLKNANMKVQLDKCEFLKTEVEYLGFIISTEGIKANPTKVEAIKSLRPPSTIKELRSFLGMSGFYRRFIKDYAKMAKPLTFLLRGEEGRMSKKMSSKIRVTLDKNALEAFEKIKNSLASSDVILAFPNLEKEFHLTTDASNYALGAVLEQDGKPIVFISRTLNKAEEHYATNEKEMLAIVWALRALRSYLYGSAAVKIFTDHQPLTYALSNKNTNSKLKRWKAILEEYNYEIKYKPGSTNVVADALSRPPQTSELNSLTITQHSAESSSQHLIQFADVPINVFKNQLIISIGNTPSYKCETIFPKYNRHTIVENDLDSEKLTKILKKYLNPTVTNGIKTEDRILGKIQEIYPSDFSQYKVRYTRTMVRDLTSIAEQDTEIINEHKRAHRNAKENKIQLLRKFYFPQMQAKIVKIVKQCRVCIENKYERHPNKLTLKNTPIPQYPGQMVHIDLYHTNNRIILTAIDKFSKYAQVRIVKSRSAEDVKSPLRELLTSFGVPENIVIDNEKSLNSSSILFMLKDQMGITVYTTPPYTSTVNGQVERFHSTLTEILRCINAEKIHGSFEDLLDGALNKYNHSIHSTTNRKPIEVFFGRITATEQERKQTIRKLTEKQEKDLEFHNKNRHDGKTYKEGDEIFVKGNKRLGNKLTPRYRKEIVQEDKGQTVLTVSKKIVHKNLIRK